MAVTALIVLLYLGAVVVANLLVAAFGPAVTIVNAFVLIAFDLTTRDYLHDRWSGDGLWWRMALLIGAGGLMSYALNAAAAQIALASFVAFSMSGALDAATYHVLGKRAHLLRVNGSNIVGAAADSLIFPTLAFGALLWPIVIGQFIAKVAGGFIWSLVLSFRRSPTASEIQADDAGYQEVADRIARTGWHRHDCPEIWGYGCACGGNEPRS